MNRTDFMGLGALLALFSLGAWLSQHLGSMIFNLAMWFA